jgi:hypothetical protein
MVVFACQGRGGALLPLACYLGGLGRPGGGQKGGGQRWPAGRGLEAREERGSRSGATWPRKEEGEEKKRKEEKKRRKEKGEKGRKEKKKRNRKRKRNRKTGKEIGKSFRKIRRISREIRGRVFVGFLFFRASV